VISADAFALFTATLSLFDPEAYTTSPLFNVVASALYT